MGRENSDAQETTVSNSPSRRTSLLAAALILATIAVHGSAINGWWLYDDPQLVLHALENSSAAILFSPTAYRYLAAHTFTPLLSLSFKLDLTLGDLEPRLFYLHQLVALAICVVLLFLLFRRFTRDWIAATATLAFVLAPPTAVLARTLMMRHYLEGLLLALGALLFWGSGWQATRVGRTPYGHTPAPESSGRAAMAGLFYLGSMIAKEIYAPLPLLMLAEAIWRGERMREIARRLVPTVAAAVIFILWRAKMLGSAGGYGDLPSLAAVVTLPITVLRDSFTGSPLVLTIAGTIVMVSLIVGGLLHSRLRALPLLAALTLFALIPIIPLAARFELRYAFVAFLSLIAGAAVASQRSRFPTATTATLWTVLCAILAVGTFHQLRQLRSVTAAMKAEGRYVWTAPTDAPPLLAGSPGWYLEGLDRLRSLNGRGRAPRFVLSREPMMIGEVASDRLLQSRWQSHVISSLQAVEKEQIRNESKRFDATIPMSLSFRRHKHALIWNLEPAVEGSWTFLSYPYYGRYPIPSSGRNRIADARERQYFRVRRDLSHGRWNLSPVLELPTEGRVVRWVTPRGE